MFSVSKEIAANSLTERYYCKMLLQIVLNRYELLIIRRAQINAALTKKRQCESQAQAIVERLLENPVDKDWLLDNVVF
jgi:hypothetical protein